MLESTITAEKPREIFAQWLAAREQFEKDHRIIPLMIDTCEATIRYTDMCEVASDEDAGFYELSSAETDAMFARTTKTWLTNIEAIFPDISETTLEKMVFGKVDTDEMNNVIHGLWSVAVDLSYVAQQYGAVSEDCDDFNPDWLEMPDIIKLRRRELSPQPA